MNFKDYIQQKVDPEPFDGGVCPKCKANDTIMITLESGKTAHACNVCGSSWNWVGQDSSVLVYGPSVSKAKKTSKVTDGVPFTGKKSKSLIDVFKEVENYPVENYPWDTMEDSWYESLKKEQEEDTLSAVPKEFRNKPKKKEEVKEKEPDPPLKPLVRRVIWDRPEPKTE